jgi:4-hydroxy-tetrahydrodipicolinate reductase
MEVTISQGPPPIKLGFIGFGKMAKAIAELAQENQEKKYLIHSSSSQDYSAKIPDLMLCDLLFDFSSPHAVKEHIATFTTQGKNMVVGTTGWDEYVAEARDLVLRHKTALFYAPNFSIGLYLFSQLIEKANSLFRPFPEFDAGGFEIHHRRKKDAPSGTMNLLSSILNKNVDPIPVSSLRVGHFCGTHTLFFDSEEERITLSHESKNRRALAKGALMAAEWLQGKKGFFTMEDLCRSFPEP